MKTKKKDDTTFCGKVSSSPHLKAYERNKDISIIHCSDEVQTRKYRKNRDVLKPVKCNAAYNQHMKVLTGHINTIPTIAHFKGSRGQLI
jgi:hypothetical protein